jgi:anthranilate phosphoribosyltransferase
MLLRVKEETGAELAGFVAACRDVMVAPAPGLRADLDWSSYAGKKHQHPWYLLALLLLAQAGYRVFLHGSAGHTPGRLYTEHAMRELGLSVARTWDEVDTQLGLDGLSYLALDYFCEPLHRLLQLKPLLGLRSPVNTLTRMLNPLRAPCSLQSIFHPAYAQLHQDADRLLGQPAAMVFKGESGEVEVKPPADTRLHWLREGAADTLTLPRAFANRAEPVKQPSVEPLRALWRGASKDDYGLAATLGTTAAALLLLGAADTVPNAHRRASELWQARERSRLD